MCKCLPSYALNYLLICLVALTGCHRVTNEGAIAFVQKCPNLKELNLYQVGEDSCYFRLELIPFQSVAPSSSPSVWTLSLTTSLSHYV